MRSRLVPEKFDVIVPAPFGPVGVYAQGMHIRIMFLESMMPIKDAPNPLAAKVGQHIQDYLNNPQKEFNLPLVYKGTPYQRSVWAAIAAIPMGQTKTYGEIAGDIDSCPRAVAGAWGANPLPIFVPCHRVVAKDDIGGFIQGKENGIAIKQWLLEHEGAI